jgi:hypothetical protein
MQKNRFIILVSLRGRGGEQTSEYDRATSLFLTLLEQGFY